MSDEQYVRRSRFRPSRRSRGTPRKRTIARKNISRVELAAETFITAAMPQVDDFDRPSSRADCVARRHGSVVDIGSNFGRPCPWVACKYHLYLDVNPETGSITLNFPHLEPWELEQGCSLDVADSGPKTLEEVGVLMNLTRERIRQVELKASFEMKQHPTLMEAA